MAIDLYTWSTPNGYKVSIMLEEVGLDYRVHPVDIGNNEQFAPDFLAISPNNKIPAIVDGELSVFDSGAILLYLAEKTGQLLPVETAARANVMQWLMFQMAHIGPMLGQLAWFTRSAPTSVPIAIDRYTNESARLFRVMDGQLQRSEYVAGELSVADIALYPWVSLGIDPIRQAAGEALGEVASLERWLNLLGQRSAFQKGMKVPELGT